MKIISFACDIYHDIVPAYHWLWNNIWPDCPYEHIYVTNSKPLGVDATVHYMGGKDIDYGRRLRRFVSLHCQDGELGLFMMADYLLKAVNPELIKKAVQLCERDDVAHCRLRPMPHPQLPPPPHLKLNKKVFGEIDRTKRYSLSLQPGIWNPKDLAKCVRDHENPWHCEIRGSGRTRRIKGTFLCTQKPAIIHHNYYRKRKPFGPIWVKKNVPKEYWTKAARRAKG
jgi:hypothetical protein